MRTLATLAATALVGGLATAATSPGGPLDSDALPPVPPPLAGADFANMKLFLLGAETSAGIVADIDSIAVVPVPAVGWMLAPLAAALAARRPKRSAEAAVPADQGRPVTA